LDVSHLCIGRGRKSEHKDFDLFVSWEYVKIGSNACERAM